MACRGFDSESRDRRIGSLKRRNDRERSRVKQARVMDPASASRAVSACRGSREAVGDRESVQIVSACRGSCERMSSEERESGRAGEWGGNERESGDGTSGRAGGNARESEKVEKHQQSFFVT